MPSQTRRRCDSLTLALALCAASLVGCADDGGNAGGRDAGVGAPDAGGDEADAAIGGPDAAITPDATPLLGPPAEPVTLAGLSVRDFALTGDQIVAVVVNPQGKLNMVACPAAGCAGAPLVLATSQPVSTLAIEADAQRAYWTTETTVEQVALDGQARSARFQTFGGQVAQALLRVGDFIYFVEWDGLTNHQTTRRIDSASAVGTSAQADLGPATEGLSIVRIGGGEGQVALWFDSAPSGANKPIRVKAVTGGTPASERTSVDSLRGTNSLAVAGGRVFWVEDLPGQQPDALRSCALSGTCAPVTTFEPVVSSIATDGATVFFASVQEQQAILVSCAATEAANGACTPTILSQDLCWLGARRLRVTATFVYGLSQTGEVCRIAR